ncbi:MAG: DUF445 domain-containing protein, partial [Negativicutes bacterium]|nr:DUF445 domain-containing protein [Negativicutes bacterium]
MRYILANVTVRKMRYSQAANRILAGVCILFIGAAVLRRQNPDNLLYEMLLMVSEAALVGGIADWFAVTALFRRPLGFPWHTALIPRNRERVIQAVVNTVEHELLSVTAIERRLAAISFMEIGIDWLENRGGQAVVGRWLTRTALGYLAKVDT